MSETTNVKKEPGTATLVVVLFLICLVTALLLGLTNQVTAPFIAENNWKTTQEAMNAVLPADSYEDVTAQYTGGDTTVEAVYQAGDAGYVVQVSQDRHRGCHQGRRRHQRHHRRHHHLPRRM